jgi:hypothetical protein
MNRGTGLDSSVSLQREQGRVSHFQQANGQVAGRQALFELQQICFGQGDGSGLPHSN